MCSSCFCRLLGRLLLLGLCIGLIVTGLLLLLTDSQHALNVTLSILSRLGIEEGTRSWLDGALR